MPEGLPKTPDSNENSENPRKKVAESGRFKLFLQELFSEKPAGKSGEKSTEDKESDNDDEESETGKKGRFNRAWRALFPKVAQKETVEGQPTAPRGLFFERDSIEDSTVSDTEVARSESVEPSSVETSPDVPTSDAAVEVPAETTVETPEVTEPTESPSVVEAPDTVPATIPPVEVPDTPVERPRTATYDRIPDEVVYRATPETSPTPQPQVIERSAAPERVVASLSTTERMRQSRMERKQREIERELREVKREVKRQEPEVVYQREKVVQKTVERAPVANKTEVVKTVEKVAQNHETIERTPNVVPERPEQLRQKQVAEQLLNTEIKEVSEDSKEIAYELSHEHKDMDKQSASAWAALQASADAQAKINAAAIAAAQAATQSAAQDEAKKLAEARQNIVYKRAITGGFITAVVIIAVIIMMILIQSR